MLKLPQTKWRYVTEFCLIMGPIAELTEWLLFDRLRGERPGQLAGEVVISTIFSIPFALFVWRIGGPGSRPSPGTTVHVDPAGELEVRASAIPVWLIPICALIFLYGVMLLSESLIVALIMTPVLLPASLLLSFFNGCVRVNAQGIELSCWYGRYWLAWSDVTGIETDAHRTKIVLFVGDCYLPLPSRMFWTGPHRFEAEALIDQHIAARRLPVRVTSRAGFRLVPRGLPSASQADDSVSA